MNAHYKKYADVAALAGRIMLESHAESYRVEDTVRRIMQTSGLNITEVVSTTTGLYMTLDDTNPEITPITQVRRISERGNHLRKIYHVNNVSRQLTAGLITIDEAKQKLEYIDDSEYTAYSKDLAVILMVVAFTLLLGGNWLEMVISVIAGTIVALSRIGRELTEMNLFMSGIFATALTAFVIPIVLSFIPQSLNSDIIIISALMPLYPGTAFMNGIRDTLKGDYNSGLARIADALVIAVSLAIGVAIGLSLSSGVLGT
ncbi:threonine/serine exporter family protein [Tuanshanicoccus lijuaniae]|uniref:threonine/serine ThrE exporter family protein n=1 Tax=Aerococcaceae bacterium zg-1292 TaxID=2774330 RepID=UPI0019377A26|nr:threonine/serine exporter family protein [Aerococcaceae bacterium zg-1292]MBF6626662.1 threonine/serine exporter family protein [Aerococcaceae bacterium zg-BR9]MBF6977627.1 threonine/serine exporter family protein [Aerococcaceae bacterium zg-BR22]MBS4456980.1 threonine/serine exporter family protein [Aerococcaceae bacterium zg-A91]MBS4458830.1 threonine/serine exporter family protein [Aerococcaceae bacterium zg-BR33]